VGFSNSIFSYQDIRELFDRALMSERGLRVRLKTKGAANNLRQRMSYYRQLDRRENKKVYTENDPMHGRSQYDILILKLTEPDPGDTENGAYLDITKGSIENFQTEEL
jgi:hypothetical protein